MIDHAIVVGVYLMWALRWLLYAFLWVLWFLTRKAGGE